LVNTQRAVARWIFAASVLFIALGVLLPWASRGRARAIERGRVGERTPTSALGAASPWLVAAATLGALSGASALFDARFRAILNSGACSALSDRAASASKPSDRR
jgi:hypothetical protein